MSRRRRMLILDSQQQLWSKPEPDLLYILPFFFSISYELGMNSREDTKKTDKLFIMFTIENPTFLIAVWKGKGWITWRQMSVHAGCTSWFKVFSFTQTSTWTSATPDWINTHTDGLCVWFSNYSVNHFLEKKKKKTKYVKKSCRIRLYFITTLGFNCCQWSSGDLRSRKSQ